MNKPLQFPPQPSKYLLKKYKVSAPPNHDSNHLNLAHQILQCAESGDLKTMKKLAKILRQQIQTKFIKSAVPDAISKGTSSTQQLEDSRSASKVFGGNGTSTPTPNNPTVTSISSPDSLFDSSLFDSDVGSPSSAKVLSPVSPKKVGRRSAQALAPLKKPNTSTLKSNRRISSSAALPGVKKKRKKLNTGGKLSGKTKNTIQKKKNSKAKTRSISRIGQLLLQAEQNQTAQPQKPATGLISPRGSMRFKSGPGEENAFLEYFQKQTPLSPTASFGEISPRSGKTSPNGNHPLGHSNSQQKLRRTNSNLFSNIPSDVLRSSTPPSASTSTSFAEQKALSRTKSQLKLAETSQDLILEAAAAKMILPPHYTDNFIYFRRFSICAHICDSNGYTPLHIAASKGHLEMVKWLVLQGGQQVPETYDPLVPGEDVDLSLDTSIRPIVEKRKKYEKLLEEASKSTNSTSNNGETGVVGLKGLLDDDELSGFEISDGDSISSPLSTPRTKSPSKNSKTSLQKGSSELSIGGLNGSLSSLSTGPGVTSGLKEFEGINWSKPLLPSGSYFPVNVDKIVNDSGATPLHVAAFHGQVEIIKWLVTSASGHIDIQDQQGFTILHFCVYSPKPEPLIQYILKECDTNLHCINIPVSTLAWIPDFTGQTVMDSIWNPELKTLLLSLCGPRPQAKKSTESVDDDADWDAFDDDDDIGEDFTPSPLKPSENALELDFGDSDDDSGGFELSDGDDF